MIDERFNSGGQVADYIIEAMRRQLMGYWSPRYGAIYRTPAASILGPKVMIINEMAGSGGDAMPWMFRYTKIGPLVGKRTWGGLIGVSQYPALMDGGNVTAPNFGFFSPEGQWDVENHGVAPDVEVEMDPKLVGEGHDPQLERAVAMALQLLEKNPPPTPKRPRVPELSASREAGDGGRFRAAAEGKRIRKQGAECRAGAMISHYGVEGRDHGTRRWLISQQRKIAGRRWCGATERRTARSITRCGRPACIAGLRARRGRRGARTSLSI